MKFFLKLNVLFLVIVSANATFLDPGHLDCRFGSWNPSYHLKVSTSVKMSFQGGLDKIEPNYVGSKKTHLGVDPIEMRLNPSNCELKILSKKNSTEEFTMSLTVGNDGLEIYGNVAGTAFGDSPLSCKAPEISFLKDLREACSLHPSIDDEISFSSTSDLQSILDNETGRIDDLKNVEILNNETYPVYAPVERVIIE